MIHSENIHILVAFLVSLILAAAIVPLVKKLSPKIGLIDKPNARKVHAKPVPVIGGLAIGITLVVSLLINPILIGILHRYYIIISTSMLLMLVGILDDKLNLKATHRLCIQLACAYALATSGIRLTSLYGIFGFGELNLFYSYFISIILITGVVNSFNLIDGIDGLAGFLALIGLSLFSYLAFILGDNLLLTILVSLIGSVLVFLFYNLKQDKIFLGDGGSLLLGLFLVATGIQLIESSNSHSELDIATAISIVFGVFLIPVLDSLRVYWSRITDGFSPFKADKRHIHHLFLFLKISHKKATLLITSSALALISILIYFYTIFGLSSAMVLVSLIFITLTSILSAIKRLDDWKSTIGELEYRD